MGTAAGLSYPAAVFMYRAMKITSMLTGLTTTSGLWVTLPSENLLVNTHRSDSCWVIPLL